jgi:hypothetical protein
MRTGKLARLARLDTVNRGARRPSNVLTRPIREKRRKVEPEDLSGNLIVQLGVALRSLIGAGMGLTTGQVITDVHVK